MTVSVTLTPILPDKFKEGAVRLYILNEVRKIRTQVKKDVERTFATWDKKPKVHTKSPSLAGGVIDISVYVKDEIYTLISEGQPSQVKVLSPDKKAFKFPGTFSAKTVPGVIDAKSGSSGPPIFSRKKIITTGPIKARKFDETITRLWETKLPEMLQEGFERAADISGHAM